MDYSHNILIDVALNAAGYLLAGLLGLTLYSMVKHKEKEASVKVKASQPDLRKNQIDNLSSGLHQENIKHKMEFIDLSNDKNRKQSHQVANNQSEEKIKLLKVADTMLRSGADSQQILKVLPITKAELASLENNKKRN